MNVSVICPTYGRLPFLPRVLAGFLSQDYKDKQLVFVNDNKHVRLSCDYEKVFCINLDQKILLPQKRNVGIGSTYSDIIMQYDDDDVFLPNKISNHVQKHLEGWEVYRNTATYIVYDDIFKIDSSSPTNISYTRKAFYEAGAYSSRQTKGEDFEFYNKIKTNSKFLEERNPDKIDFVYNWSGINYHATYTSDQDIEQIATEQLKEMGFFDGVYPIHPNWDEYNKFVKLHEEYNGPRQTRKAGYGKINV